MIRASSLPDNIKAIKNFDGYYISNEGVVYSAWRRGGGKNKRDELSAISNRLDKYGYRRASMLESHPQGRLITRHIHRLVLDAFDRPKKKGEQCRHLDGNKLNNAVSNLKWGTSKENHSDGRAKSKRCGKILDADKIREIRRLYIETNVSYFDLAKRFGVDKCTILHICHRKSWKHIK